MVEENAVTASRKEPLSEEPRAQIMAALDETKRLADLYCTACGYCMPCPNDVNIPKNLEYMNYYRVYGLKEYARQVYADLGVKNTEWIKGLKAEYCIQCGECEPKCLQRILIMAQLEEVARGPRAGWCGVNTQLQMTRRVAAHECGPLLCVRHDIDGGADLWYHMGAE